MNGQRFHQQKQIEMKTEQCEHSLTHGLSLLIKYHLDSLNNYNLLSLFYHVILRVTKMKLFVVTLAIKSLQDIEPITKSVPLWILIILIRA